jgi:hypothetical protein
VPGSGRRRAVSAYAVLAGLVVSGCFPARTGSAGASRVWRVATFAVPASAAATAAPAPWSERAVATVPASLDFYPDVIQPGTDDAVGVATSSLPAFSRLYRIDLRTGKLQRGSLVFSSGQLVSLGGELAYVEPRTERVQPGGDVLPDGPGESLEVRFLHSNAATLSAAHYLPLSVGDTLAPVSASTATDWAGVKGKVLDLDLVTGRVLKQVRLPDPDGQFGVTADRSSLYATANATGRRPMEVYAVSLPSGTLVGSKAILGVGGYAVAVPSGVWVSYRTGMMGTAELLSSPRLATESPRPASTLSPVPLPGTSQGMGIELTVTGGTAWLVDISAVACVSATTGRVRADASLGDVYGSFHVIGAIGRRLYAVTGDRTTSGTRIVEVQAPAACWRN